MPVADVVTVVVSEAAGDRGTAHARWLVKRRHWSADLPDSWGSSYGMAVRQTIGLVDLREWFSRLEGGRTDVGRGVVGRSIPRQFPVVPRLARGGLRALSLVGARCAGPREVRGEDGLGGRHMPTCPMVVFL